LHSYNSVAWIQGKHTFESIEIKLRDDITNSVVRAVGAQVQKQMNHFEQTSAAAGINYKFSMEIHALDGSNGEPIERWFLEGCFINVAAYGDGDYASGESQEVTLTIRFDNATNLGGSNPSYSLTNPYPNNVSPSGGKSAL
jgi:hypothetical protein